MFNNVNKLFVTAGAVAIATTVSAPAHALTLNGDFNFAGRVRIFRSAPTTAPNNYQFDFLRTNSNADAGTAGDLTVGAGTGSFSNSGTARISDLSSLTAVNNFPNSTDHQLH